MAEVWEGYDQVLARPVAVKILHEHLAADEIFRERFRREAITAARLAHPGVVATYDTGIDAGTAYIVMELVRGWTLRQLLGRQGSLELPLAVGLARQVSDALAYAHRSGLIHRDVKPANVLLAEDDWGVLRAKVTDFGIAKASEGLGQDLTNTGMVLGTPKYLSPEQIRGEEPDARADLYSLGVVLYEMVAGQPPFVGKTDMAIALAHLNDPPVPLIQRRHDTPPALDRIVGDLLAKDPARRVPTAAALSQALGRVAQSGLPGGRPASAAPFSSDRSGSGGASRPNSPTPSGPLQAGPGAPASTTNGIAGPVGGPPTGSGPRANRSGPYAAVPLGQPGPGRAPPGQFGPGGHPRGGALPGRAGTSPADPRSSPPHRRRHLVGVGVVVACVALVALILAGVLLLETQGKGSSSGTGGTGSATAIAVQNVTVFMANNRRPDNPDQTKNTFDGNQSTVWSTDIYRSPTFGGLYPGIGLAIDLGSSHALHRLSVTSATQGWAAQAYTSATAVATGQSVSAWGSPTATQTDIRGNTTFDLGGHQGRYVLLWLTNLGPADQASIAEVTVT